MSNDFFTHQPNTINEKREEKAEKAEKANILWVMDKVDAKVWLLAISLEFGNN